MMCLIQIIYHSKLGENKKKNPKKLQTFWVLANGGTEWISMDGIK